VINNQLMLYQQPKKLLLNSLNKLNRQ